jgi:hypothetical protein
LSASGTFIRENGTANNLPSIEGGSLQGPTHVTGITQFDWKNADTSAADYASFPITAGNNSYDNYIAMLWTGSFNMITGVLINHTYNTNGTAMGAGITIKCLVSGSGLYRTPATTTYATFTSDLTSTGSISTGLAVLVSAAGRPGSTGKVAFTTSNPAVSQYFGSQLISTSSASPGDTAQSVFTIQWTEN